MPPSPARARTRRPEERVPGLLEALAQVADPRQRRGRRFTLAFTLAVALGGVPCPLRRKIPVPSEWRTLTPIRHEASCVRWTLRAQL